MVNAASRRRRDYAPLLDGEEQREEYRDYQNEEEREQHQGPPMRPSDEGLDVV